MLMGELIARAVYGGVSKAVRRQNGLFVKRSIFHRLQECRITTYDFLEECRLPQGKSAALLIGPLEELLLDKHYATFIESALALSDAWQRHQLSGLDSFRDWCRRITDEISGQPQQNRPRLYFGVELPEPLRLALEALVHGVVETTN